MDLTCESCDEGTASDGNPCDVCGGDGVLNFLDSKFARMSIPIAVFGQVWNDILTRLSDIEDKVDDVMDTMQRHQRSC